MLFYLSTFPFVALSIVFWGLIALRQIGGADALRVSEFKRPHDLVFCAAWLGISIIAGFLTLIAHITPVSLYVVIFVLAIPLVSIAFTTFRMETANLVIEIVRHRDHLLRPITFLWLMLVPISYFGSQQIVYFDTAFYHLPMARILEEFGVIKGMVTIHMNYGQASSWLVLSAPGTAGGENGWGAQSANVYLVMLAASQAAFAFYRIGNRSKRLPDIIAGFGITLVLLLAVRWGMTASLSPDLPAMLLSVIVAWLLSNDRIGNCLLIALPISVFAVTVKLSAAPLALLVGSATLTLLFHERRRILTSIGISALIFASFFSLSILSSGCLAFPAGLTCLQLPWTPAPDRLADHTNLIVNAARGGGRVLPAGTSTIDGLIHWMSRDISGAILVLGGWLLTVGLATFKYVGGQQQSLPMWPLLFALTGLFYVTALAPSGRFAGGYTAILVAVVVYATPWLHDKIQRISQTALLPCLLASMLCVIHATGPANTVRKNITAQVADTSLKLPGYGFVVPKRLIPFDINQPDLQHARYWEFDQRDGIKVTRPTRGNECWSAPPPCFPRGIQPGTQFIDNRRGVSGGFAMEQAHRIPTSN